jgi:hypothetical protein
MPRPPQDIDIELVEPEGGIDSNRLSLALSMLISEKDIIEFFTPSPPRFKPANHGRRSLSSAIDTNYSHNKPSKAR